MGAMIPEHCSPLPQCVQVQVMTMNLKYIVPVQEHVCVCVCVCARTHACVYVCAHTTQSVVKQGESRHWKLGTKFLSWPLPAMRF